MTAFSYSGTNSTVTGGVTTVTTYPTGTGATKPKDVTKYQYSSNVLVKKTAGATTTVPTTTSYAIDPNSLLPFATQVGGGGVSTVTYETFNGPGGTEVSSANKSSSTDASGANTSLYSYNSKNQLWCTVRPAEKLDGATCPATPITSPPTHSASYADVGDAISYYATTGELKGKTDPLGNTTVYVYTGTSTGVPKGLLYCTVDPVDYHAGVTCPAYGATHVTGTATSTFDSAGDVETTTDPTGAKTKLCYYFQSGPSTCAHSATTSHDGGNPDLVYSTTSPSGTVTTFTYDGAGKVVDQVQAFAGYSATTVDAYTGRGLKYCTINPLSYSQGHTTCPTPAPTSLSTVASWTGRSVSIFDTDGRPKYSVNPLGGITQYGYDQAGDLACTITPTNYASPATKRCPTLPITLTHSTYKGKTIQLFDGQGRVKEKVDALGAATVTTYNGAGLITETVKASTTSTAAPNVTTTTTYNTDNQPTTIAVGTGGNKAVTTKVYDPDGSAYCTISPSAYALGTSHYHCPVWQASWANTPPKPHGFYSSTPTAAEAEDVSLSFANADGKTVETFDADGHPSAQVYDGDSRSYCTIDAVNLDQWVTTGHTTVTYPYYCPAPTSSVPSTGSNPKYTFTTYNASNQVKTQTNQLGDTTTTTYDTFGNPTTASNGASKTTTSCYFYQYAEGKCPLAWVAPTDVDGSKHLTGISCPTGQTCFRRGSNRLRPPGDEWKLGKPDRHRRNEASQRDLMHHVSLLRRS